MARLNLDKLTTLDNSTLVSAYKSKVSELEQSNMVNSIKLVELQTLIQKIYNEHPEAIPDEYLIEEDENVNNK